MKVVGLPVADISAVKGVGDGWPAKRVIMDIEELGYAGTPINLK